MVMPENLTQWLQRADGADRAVLDQLYPLLYDELHRMAHQQLRRSTSETLNTTGLVHESFLKLVGGGKVAVQNRAHFFSLAARAMRFILVDYARTCHRSKRGSGEAPQPLTDIVPLPDRQVEELLALDAALDRLGSLSDRLRQLVEHRYFAGLTLEETADVMGVSLATTKRDWDKAKAFLARELTHG
jgi:RNA polymerase sigma factor (TIGR02999 family)